MVKLGDRLSEERKKQGITLFEVARATKIRENFLEAIEKGDYKKLPSSAYAQGFVKNYIDFLGLPEKELLALFRREFREEEFLGVLPKSFTRPEDIPLGGTKFKRAAIFGLGIILVLALYIIFQYKSVFLGPSISLIDPLEHSKITQNTTVSGTTDPNSTVLVNNLPVFVDNSGNFTKQITLFPGPATITVKSTNSFGKTSVVERHVIVMMH